MTLVYDYDTVVFVMLLRIKLCIIYMSAAKIILFFNIVAGYDRNDAIQNPYNTERKSDARISRPQK